MVWLYEGLKIGIEWGGVSERIVRGWIGNKVRYINVNRVRSLGLQGNA
jgi:hypothetical protein